VAPDTPISSHRIPPGSLLSARTRRGSSVVFAPARASENDAEWDRTRLSRPEFQIGAAGLAVGVSCGTGEASGPSAAALARDHGVSRATSYRYLDEVIFVLAEQAPDLREVLERAQDQGFSHVILDGKIVPCDRCKEPAVSVKGEVIDLWYSGKAHAHGANIQAVMTPDGFPLWVSPVEPGWVRDLTAARAHALPALYHAAATGLPTLADPGYESAGIGILIPVKQPTDGRELDINARTRNAIQWSPRCLGERGFALLTGRWRTLRHITASPSKIGDIARAALVLTHVEHGYITWKTMGSCRGRRHPIRRSSSRQLAVFCALARSSTTCC
jgi:DDE superfamily endonuclease